MAGEGMVAVVEGLQDYGLAVTMVKKQQFVNSIKSSSQNSGASASSHAKETPDRGPVNDTAAQIIDGRYASTYQVAHCNVRPTAPRDYVTEFPPQRLAPCPNQGNFQIGTGEYHVGPVTSRARNLSHNDRASPSGYNWLRDRSPISPVRLSPTRQNEIPTRMAVVQPSLSPNGRSISPAGRESPTGHVSRPGRQPRSASKRGWTSPIPGSADIDQFPNSLRRYPLTSCDKNGSSELLQKLLNYTQNKHLSKISVRRKRSPQESPTRDMTSQNIQTYTRNKSEPTKDPGPTTTNKKKSPYSSTIPVRSNSNKRRAISNKRSISSRRSISPKRSTSSTRSVSPQRSSSPKRSRSPQRSSSPKSDLLSPIEISTNRMNSPDTSTLPCSDTYEYLKPGRGKKVEVRYLDDVRKCIRDTLQQIYDDTASYICPKVEERYSRHREIFHDDEKDNEKGFGTEADTTKKTDRGQDTERQPQRKDCCPCKTPIPRSCQRVPGSCVCTQLRWPCMCGHTSKDSEKVKLGAKIAEATINWVNDLPVYANETCKDKDKREVMIMDLVCNLKRIIGDPEFENNARQLIKECIEKLPIWYPVDEKDKDTFKNQITDELVDKLNNIVDKMTDVISKWLNGLEFSDYVNKGEVVKNMIKRLKPLTDRPEDMETEIKNMIQDLPILNKTKDFEKISGKLVDDLASVAADIVLEKEIKKWLDNTPVLNGANNIKNSKTLAEKIKQAVDREPNDSNYQEVVRKIVDDWIEDITRSGEYKLASRTKANLADQLVEKLKILEKNKPVRRDRSLSNQKDNVDFIWNWLTNNDVIPEQKRIQYKEPVNNLAKNLQKLQSSGARDEETAKEIMIFFDNLVEEGETIVDKDKLVKKLVQDLKRNSEQPSSIEQYDERISEWLADVVGMSEEQMKKYKDPVKDLTKKLQKLQSRGAEDDKITEEIIDFLDFLTENGEPVINKDKVAKQLIKDLKKTDTKPNLLKQCEDRTLECLTDVAGIPEEHIEKYKGPLKDFAKKLQKLQSRGADDDEIKEEIMDFLDFLTENGEPVINKDKVAKQLIKDLKKTDTKPNLLKQCEDRTLECLTDVAGIPEEHIEKYKGPLKDFAKKLQKLQSRGADDDEIKEEIMDFLDFLTENGEPVINKDKVAKQLIKDLKKTDTKPNLLKQCEDRTLECLTDVAGIPEEHIEKYKGPLKDFAKKLQKLQSRGADDDEIKEEIMDFLDFLTENGEPVINKDKVAKQLIKDLKKTDTKPNLLKQCEDRTLECLTDVAGIPEEHIEKYKGPLKDFAKKLQKLQSKGAEDDEIKEEIIGFLDFLTENGESVINKDKVAKQLIKDLRKSDKKPNLLKQNEDRTLEWLSEVVEMPEENIAKFKGPVRLLAKHMEELQSKGAEEDEILEEILTFLNFFTGEGETVVNKDKLAKILMKDLNKSNEKPTLLEQCEDRTSEWLSEIVDIPDENREKYKGPVKELANKLQELLSIEADDDEIAGEIKKFYNYLTNEEETVVQNDDVAQNLIEDILSLGERNKTIPKSKKRKSKSDIKFSKKKRQGVKSSGTSGDESAGEKLAKNHLRDKKTTVRNKTAQNLSKDTKTGRKPSAVLKQSIIKEISGLIGDIPINKSNQNELKNDIADILTQNFNDLPEKNNKSHRDIKNLLMKGAKMSDKDASKIASSIINRVKSMPINSDNSDLAFAPLDSVVLTKRRRNLTPKEISPMQRENFVEIAEKEISDFVYDFLKDDSPEARKLNEEKFGKLAEILGENISNPTVKDKKKAVLGHISDFFNDLPVKTNIPRAELTKLLADRILNIGFQTSTPKKDGFLTNKPDFDNSSINYEDDSVESSQAYTKQLIDILQAWIEEVMPKKVGRTFKNKMAGELAEKIFDRQNYLHLNPNAITTNEEELASLKYEVYRLANKILSGHDLLLVIRKVDDLMKQIEKLKKLNFVTTKTKVARSQRSSIDRTSQLTSVPVLDNNEFIQENLKGGVQDWLRNLPLYQRANSKDKRELENMIPKLVSAITSVIENAPTAEEAEKLITEEIVKQLKKSPINPELKSHETFLRNTAAALLENFKELQLFQDISDRHETTTNPLQAVLDDWVGSLPIKRLNSSEATKLEQQKKDFAGQLEQIRKIEPNNDEKIKKNIKQNLLKFPIEESMKQNQKFIAKEVENLFRNLLIVPIKYSELKTKVIKKAADILFDAIEDYCEKLPFESTLPQAKQEIAKKELASKLINKIGELNMNPEAFNDEFLYIQMFEDELDALLADIISGDDKKNLPELKNNFLENVKEARQKNLEEIAGQTYKHQLRDTISKNVPFETLSAEEKAAFEAVKDFLVDAFMNLHYVGDNEEQKQKYKTDIQKELSEFCDDYLKNHVNVPLDTVKLNENLYQALRAVPIPTDETLIPEVELAKVKEDVNKWVKELPLRMQTEDEKLKIDKLAAVLAKKIRNIEKQNELDHNTDFNDELTKPIKQWMDKLLEHLDENTKNAYANKLVDNLAKTRQTRRVSANMRRSIDAEFFDGTLNKKVSCKERCKLPCSIERHGILSIEDAQHLEKIRARVKSTQMQKNTGSQTATPAPCEKPGYTMQEAGSSAEVVPRLIVKEYYWDTASSQYVESQNPCSREHPPCSPISSRCSPISPSCSMRSPTGSPPPGSCLLQHENRFCSPSCSNARLSSPKHTVSQRPLEPDPCRSDNIPASYQNQPRYEQSPSPLPDLSQRRPSRRLPDDHEPCSPCPFGLTVSSQEIPPPSYHRDDFPPPERHVPFQCRGNCAKAMLGFDYKKPCRKFRGGCSSWRERLDDCITAQPYGKRTKPEGYSCRGNHRERNEDMKRCSKCCGIHCPFPSYMYFK